MRFRSGGAALAIALAVAACGGECRVILSSGLVVGCGDVPPGPGDPSFGSAAEVLLTDCSTNQLVWVGINAQPTPTPPPGGGSAQQDDDVFEEFDTLRCAGNLNWIGGTVLVANDVPGGFYFNPAAILVLESAPLEMQTTIAAISGDPQFYANGGDSGVQWVVPAEILDIETSETLMCPLAPACTA